MIVEGIFLILIGIFIGISQVNLTELSPQASAGVLSLTFF
jgi:hypothetical protein